MRTPNPHLHLEHTAIVNRVADYIDDYLGDELSLDVLASHVSVSSYYLHRMFARITGDNLSPYIMRRRIVRAAHHLICDPRMTVTEIADRCGFSALAHLSRAFKKATGSSPESFRSAHAIGNNRKIGQIEGKDSESHTAENRYNEDHDVRGEPLRVSVREIPGKTTLYIRHYGIRRGVIPEPDVRRSFGTLGNLATRRELWTSGSVLLGIPHFPLLPFPFAEYGYDACITVPHADGIDGEASCRILPGGTYAVLRLEDPAEALEPKIRRMLTEWLPESGYLYDVRPAMMINYNDPALHPDGKWIMDVCLPVRT